MEFWDFLLRDQVIDIFLGTLIAFGLTRFAESLEKNVLRPFIKKNVRVTGQTKLGNVFSSFLELTVVMVLVYLVYRFAVKRIWQKEQKEQKVSIGESQMGGNKAVNIASEKKREQSRSSVSRLPKLRS